MSSGHGVPQESPTDCPKCGTPAKDVLSTTEQPQTPELRFEAAIRCDACADTYLRIKGRWWSTR